MAGDEDRVWQIKEYVLARLRSELANGPRGSQARLAKKLGVSGAHLSNMLSPRPSRQPGEDFRRKVAAHWGISYAQLEALALGEDPLPPGTRSFQLGANGMPPNLSDVLHSYAWMPELPEPLKQLIAEQARLHHVVFDGVDYPHEEWRHIVTGLEREALGIAVRRDSLGRERGSWPPGRVVTATDGPRRGHSVPPPRKLP